jgi:hypothetical protein
MQIMQPRRVGFASAAARKSACFWLSPSITTRSPGSMIASSNPVARSGGQIFEPGPHINAALAHRHRGLLRAGLILPS